MKNLNYHDELFLYKNNLDDLKEILTFLGFQFTEYKGKTILNGHSEAKTVGEIAKYFGKYVMTTGVFLEDFKDLDFKNNWGDLMFLVEKIEDKNFIVEIKGISCKITKLFKEESIILYVLEDKTKKIDLVYNTVVDFCKWYNKNN